MSRRTTLFIPGGYYHIYNRGANKVSLFRTEANYLHALALLKDYSRRLQVSVIAYCLMPNHYHWLVRQDGDAAAGLLPQRVFNVYSHVMHHVAHHSGTLFEGPYKIIKVSSEPYLCHLCRYIHANPVHHGIFSDITRWPYSNYPEWIGIRGGTLLDKDFIQQRFPVPGAYQAFVEAYLAGHSFCPSGLADYLQQLDPL